MSKIKFARHPRSIIQSRKDHPSTLTVTIPAKIVKEMQLQAGGILQFVGVQDGTDAYIKVRPVAD